MSIERSFLLGSLFLGCFTLPALGQARGLVWTHGNSATEFWVSQHVAVADSGTQVFAELGANLPTRLLSAFDQQPPTPVWSYLSPQTAQTKSVDAADETDTYASLAKVGSTMVLRRHSSSSPLPLWSYTFPFSVSGNEPAAVRVTPDGRRIVAGVFDIPSFLLKVAVFDANSASPLAYHSLDSRGAFKAFEIDDRAQRLYVASIAVRVFDLSSGAMLHHESPWSELFDGHDFSGDGEVFAYGTWGAVKVFRRVGNAYVQDFVHTHPGSNVCNRIAISSDGSTLACAFDFYDTGLRVDVDAIDLSTHALTMSDSVTAYSAAGYQNRISDLVISNDGHRIVAAMWGDETGAAPEVLAYDRNQSAPVLTFDLPGSPFDVDISPDGKRLAVASKLVHRLSTGAHGKIDLYELDPLDFDLRGVPRTGRTVTFELHGAPGTSATLLASNEKASPPRFLEHLGGVLYLQRRSIVPSSMGTMDWTGTARASRTVTGPVGSARYFQGLAAMPGGLSDGWVKVTVLP